MTLQTPMTPPTPPIPPTPPTPMARPFDDTPPILALGAARLLAGAHVGRAVSYTDHRAVAGPLPRRDRARLVAEAGQVGLLGRGGAAFPVAVKLSATPSGRHTQVLVNGSESEPASWKDRVLLRRAPHRVLDGALLVAASLGTRHVTIAVHDEPAAYALTAACAERPDAEEVRVIITATTFVGGEVRALVKTLEGLPPVPDGRRVLPHVRGLRDRPTFASNAETFAQLDLLATLGPQEYAALGSPTEPGTSLVTMLGSVPRGGVAEVPNGTSLELLAGTSGPVLVGGYHGTWTRAAGLRLDRRLLLDRGVSWGAGVLGVLPDHTCPLGEVARVASWLAGESTGQCGPCLYGLASIARDLDALAACAPVDVADLRRRVGLVDGRGACSHPSGAVRFVASALQVFADEVSAHRSGRGCDRRVRGVLPVPAAAGSVR